MRARSIFFLQHTSSFGLDWRPFMDRAIAQKQLDNSSECSVCRVVEFREVKKRRKVKKAVKKVKKK